MIFPVADAHCDFLYNAVQTGYDLVRPKRDQVIRLNDLQAGHVALQFFACWIDTTLRTPPLHQCIAMIDAYNRMLEQNAELISFTRDFSPNCGKIGTVLTVEGGEAMEGSLAVLRTLYRLGVRAMTLTWNEANELSGAAMARNNKGLTAVGREMIDEMTRLGIAIDVSHLSDKGIDDILAQTSQPIFASHSNARSVYACPRALQDTHIRAIAQRGGVVGINFYYQQLGPNSKANISDIVRHICHVVQTGGIDCCAIGSDFDGMQQYPRDLRSSRDFPALMRALALAGFSDDAIYKIAYLNLANYIAQFV
ncbi:MAG: dipeptidase [Clostridia bacterium]